jgi:lipopolysaccharide transport system permease protein
VPPVASGLVFIFLQSRRILNVAETDVPYPVYVLIGTVLWQLFTESLNAPLKSATLAKPILAKINFPYEALILSSIYSVLLSMVIKSIVLAAILIIFRVPINWSILWAPLAFLVLIVLGIGIGVFLIPFGMLYSDITIAMPVILQLLFFLTPVVYSPPTSYPFNIISYLNPVTPLLVGARDLITKGGLSNINAYASISALAVAIFFIGWLIYKVSIPIFIERISA